MGWLLQVGKGERKRGRSNGSGSGSDSDSGSGSTSGNGSDSGSGSSSGSGSDSDATGSQGRGGAPCVKLMSSSVATEITRFAVTSHCLAVATRCSMQTLVHVFQLLALVSQAAAVGTLDSGKPFQFF